jgi:SH3-like domain-containing protein
LWFDSYSTELPDPPKMTKVPVPAEKYCLYAAEDDLALRAEPSLSSYLWKRMVMGTELTCLEPKATAKTKVGVNNQWINVQDSNGDQGYVAAWYVSEAKGQPTPSAAPTVASASSTAPVAAKLPPGALAFVPTQELSFRTQPVIAPENVIRYVPVTETLICVEPANQAIPKVGVNGQWLRVRDASGKEGYVAAWYVRYASGSNAQQATTGTATGSNNGSPLKVKATAEGTALRNQPIVSDATLIKRLPLGTELIALDPDAASKIGQNNQWIKVKDPGGAEGYVAAWFVAR